MHPADWLRRQQAQNEPSYNPQSYQSYNAYYGTAPSYQAPNYSNTSMPNTTAPIDPKYAYLYNSFKPDKKTKFASFRANAGQQSGQSSMEQEFEAERPSFMGAPPPMSEGVKRVIDMRKEKYIRMMRESDQPGTSQSYELVDLVDDDDPPVQEKPSHATIVAKLNDEYSTVLKATNMTSEMRINRLITSIKRTLGELSVPPYEYQQYVESFVSRLISEKKWTGLSLSTAVFLTVAQPVRVEEEAPNAWYKCMMCKLAYPPGEFTCNGCGQKFKTKPDLYVHELEQHGSLHDEHTQCEICGKVFYKNPQALKAHFRLNHMCQFEHLECMFGCKTLVLGTHSRALAEHVYSCHACVECNDLLSGSLEKHLEIFHSTSSPENPNEKTESVSYGSRSGQLSQQRNESSTKSKRQLSPSPEPYLGRKRVAREIVGTFDSNQSFINNLLDDGEEKQPPQNALEFLFRNRSGQTQPTYKRRDELTSTGNSSGSKDLAQEIDMMFSKPATSKSSKSSSGIGSSLEIISSSYGSSSSRNRDIAKSRNSFEMVSSADPFSTRTTASRQRVIELRRSPSPQRAESPPNEIRQLEDENSNSLSRKDQSSKSRMLGRSNLYAEEFRGGVVTTQLPVYKGGLYYTGSPPRDVSPASEKNSSSRLRVRARSRSVSHGRKSRSRTPNRKGASPSMEVRYDKYILSPKRDSKSGSKSSQVDAASKPYKLDSDKMEKLPKPNITQCRLCHFSCPGNGGHTCRICKKQFLMETKLVMHMNSEHQLKVPMSLKCTFCQKDQDDVKSLHKHLIETHLCSEEHYQCSYHCDMLFTKENYKIHLENKHNRFFCDKCEKDFNITKSSHNCKPKKKPGVDKETLSKLMDEADGVFSDDELKIVQVNESTEMFAAAKDEVVVVSMAPRDFAPKINVKKNRTTFQNIDLTRAMIQSGDKDEYKRKGLFYCSKCPLVYNPTLKTCSKCDLLFFDAKDLALHAIDAHGCSMDMTDIGCEYCTEVFPGYEELLNHRSTHFCQEHIECSDGCRELIVGRTEQLKIHAREKHSDSTSNVEFFAGHISSDASKDEKKPNVDMADMVRCNDCPIAIPRGFEMKCDKCSVDSQQTFYTQDEYAYHLEKQHRISNKGDFKCTWCNEPQSFKNDLPGLIAHKIKKHKICKNHIKCPRVPCETIMSKGKLETHLRKECDFVDPSDCSVRPWFVYESAQVKVCEKCDYALHTTRLYKCTECNAVCADKYDFYAHLKLDHKKDEITNDLEFVCAQCPGTASFSASRWRNHRAEKHGYCDNHFVCVNMACDLMFGYMSSLKKHLQNNSECRNHPTIEPSEPLGEKMCTCCSQIKEQTVSRTCVLCANKNVLPFTDNTEYSMHLTYRHNKHVQSNGTIRCDSCKASFSNYGDLGNHRIREHRICNKHSFCKGGRSCHFVFHFKETGKPHACSAGASYRNKSKPKKSKSASKLVKSSEKYLWNCADCNLMTNARPSLFHCRHGKCESKFVTQSELSAHQVVKHKMTVSGNFQCFLCPGHPVFVDAPEKLQEHNVKTHGFCKAHKKCPTPGCCWLFNSENDISRHLEHCLGITKSVEDLKEKRDTYKSSSSKSRESSPRKTLSKKSYTSNSSKSAKKSPRKDKDNVIDYRKEEGEVEEKSGRSDIESKSKLVKLDAFSLLHCTDCSKKFWIDSVLECTQCDATTFQAERQFLSRHELSAHLELKHKTKLSTAQQCSMCNEKFLKANDLLQHVKQIHHCCETHFGCFAKDCQHVYGGIDKLKEHQRTAHRKEPESEEKVDSEQTKEVSQMGKVEADTDKEAEERDVMKDLNMDDNSNEYLSFEPVSSVDGDNPSQETVPAVIEDQDDQIEGGAEVSNRDEQSIQSMDEVRNGIEDLSRELISEDGLTVVSNTESELDRCSEKLEMVSEDTEAEMKEELADDDQLALVEEQRAEEGKGDSGAEIAENDDGDDAISLHEDEEL